MFSPAEGFYATEGLGKNEIRIAYVLKQDDMRRGVQLIRLGLEKYKARSDYEVRGRSIKNVGV